MEYPKVMTIEATGQSVVVANEAQEKALPSEYGGKAKGKSYADIAAAEKAETEEGRAELKKAKDDDEDKHEKHHKKSY